jgi:N-acetylglucosaminyldiphosphoundecaprenol N-acetyl-beta-D-mannosaminyltransferase
METQRVNILGVGVHAIRIADALRVMQAWIEQRQANYVCCAPAHAIMECYDHPDLRPVYNHSGLTTPDGMPIVWLVRWAGHKQVARVYGPDLLLAACQDGLERGWRHYFYGGAPGVPERLVQRLRDRFPELQVTGIESPPFRELDTAEQADAVERIRAAQADILWLGLGSPRQERWMAANVEQLGVPVQVGVGAAFDFLSGNKPQAPRWMQRSGLEWLFRLFSEPRRLWKRYLLGYPRFVTLVLLQKMGLKRYPLE